MVVEAQPQVHADHINGRDKAIIADYRRHVVSAETGSCCIGSSRPNHVYTASAHCSY